MAVITCWSLKGGSGTTVVAAGLALAGPGAVLVDLDGELPAALGMAEPPGQGLSEWLASEAPPSAVGDLAVAIDRRTSIVPRGADPIDREHRRWPALTDWMAADRRLFVIDAGTGIPPEALVSAPRQGVRNVLVTRPCYLSLRRLQSSAVRPGAVVLLAERDRALGARDVAHSAGAPVLAQVPDDPAIARAVDAGLLASRLPGSLLKPLRQLRRACRQAAAP